MGGVIGKLDKFNKMMYNIIINNLKKKWSNNMTTITDGKHTFEIVEKIPKGFFIWNIGILSERYLAIAELDNHADKNCHFINKSTLKAIELPKKERELLDKAAGYGVRESRAKRGIGLKAKNLAILALEVHERIAG